MREREERDQRERDKKMKESEEWRKMATVYYYLYFLLIGCNESVNPGMLLCATTASSQLGVVFLTYST